MSGSTKLRGYALVLLAGSLWAMLGIFFHMLRRHELRPETIALLRAAISAALLAGFWAVARPRMLLVRRADLPYLLAFGLGGVAAFYLSYVFAIERGSVAMAAVLLYTAPLWIALYAWWRWGEALRGWRLAALGLAFAGCALVALGPGAELAASAPGILFGLASGLSYAAYSLWSAEGLRRGYQPWTIVTYSLLIGSLGMLPFQPQGALSHVAHTPEAWPALLGIALVSTIMAPICYTLGLRQIGAPTASIIATIEPVVAALLAWRILGQELGLAQVLGGLAILGAIVLLARGGSGRGRHDQS